VLAEARREAGRPVAARALQREEEIDLVRVVPGGDDRRVDGAGGVAGEALEPDAVAREGEERAAVGGAERAAALEGAVDQQGSGGQRRVEAGKGCDGDVAPEH